MRGRADGTYSAFTTVAILLTLPLVGMFVFFIWQRLHGGVTPGETITAARAAIAPSRSALPAVVVLDPRDTSEHVVRTKVPNRKRMRGGDIVLIIDDLGFDGQPIDRLMALDPNISCSILPNGTRTRDVAEKLHRNGFEILCHLPMEPRGNEAPGRNAVLTSMSDEEITDTTRENLDAVPHARGANNHMGSLATADRRVMRNVLKSFPEGMYFIDSRTVGASVAASVAREMNVPTAERHVFLDDDVNERSVRRQLAQLADAASKHGMAIGIGHPHAVTMRVLAAELPSLKAQGFRLVRASEVVR